jgi:nitrogen regulatory protein P-II 1
MKEIKAIIDPRFIYQVMEALHKLDHFPGVTISDAQGQGRGEGKGGKHVSLGDPLSFKRTIKLEIFCSDQDCDKYVKAILEASHSATAGRGIIQVTPLDRVIRISTGQKDNEAV